MMSLAVSAQPARRAEHASRLKATAAPLQNHRETLLAVEEAVEEAAAAAVEEAAAEAAAAEAAEVAVAPVLAAAATAENVLPMGACQVIVMAGSKYKSPGRCSPGGNTVIGIVRATLL